MNNLASSGQLTDANLLGEPKTEKADEYCNAKNSDTFFKDKSESSDAAEVDLQVRQIQEQIEREIKL